MPPSNPTPDQLIEMRRLIARLNGWRFTGPYWGGDLRGLSPEGNSEIVPNWSGDRNASYELPVKAGDRDYFIAASQIAANHNFPCRLLDLVQPLLWPAYWESLAWLLYKGYRWVECEKCVGVGRVLDDDMTSTKMDTCMDCSGQGRKFVKEVTDDDE